MDLTIIYVLLIIIIVIGLSWLSKYLKDNDIVDSEDLLFAMTILDLSMKIIDELNLKDEDKIKDIAEIVKESVDYINKSMSEEADKEVWAIDYAYKLCEEMDIELTDNRKEIIIQLIGLQLKK
jgi:hypothetical protein